MSNYSDFFGVGSSGGGGGIPINSYTPFYTISTGNPTGYDQVTGLYTHPDGSFWLETGKQIAGATSTYPSAAVQYSIPTGNAVATGFTIAQGSAVFSLEYKSDNGNIMVNTVEYTTAGVATGFSITQVAGGTRNIGYSPVSQTYYGSENFSFNVHEYDSAGIATGFSFDTSPQNPGAAFNVEAMTVGVDDNIYVAFGGSAANSGVFQYTKAGVYTGYSITALSNNFPRGIHMDGANIWLGTSFSAFQIYDSTGTFQITVNYTGGGPSGAEQGITWDGSQFFYLGSTFAAQDIYQYTLPGNPGAQIGDGTARTDTDTSQPLFLRIK